MLQRRPRMVSTRLRKISRARWVRTVTHTEDHCKRSFFPDTRHRCPPPAMPPAEPSWPTANTTAQARSCCWSKAIRRWLRFAPCAMTTPKPWLAFQGKPLNAWTAPAARVDAHTPSTSCWQTPWVCSAPHKRSIPLVWPRCVTNAWRCCSTPTPTVSTSARCCCCMCSAGCRR